MKSSVFVKGESGIPKKVKTEVFRKVGLTNDVQCLSDEIQEFFQRLDEQYSSYSIEVFNESGHVDSNNKVITTIIVKCVI